MIRRYSSLLALLAAVTLMSALGACAGQPPALVDRKTPLPLPLTEQEPAAGQAVRDYLAGALSVQAGQIGLEMLEALEWPDSCLGLPPIGNDPCGADPVAGYRWLAEVNGERYLFHSDESGRLLRLAAGPE